MTWQTTLGRPVALRGVGLHSGRRAVVRLHPAAASTGWRIAWPGVEGKTAVSTENWVPSRMSTSLFLAGGQRLRTVEHLAAALHACGIDNVLIEVTGSDKDEGEVPIMDGSALAWLRLLDRAGLVQLASPRLALRVLRPVQVERDGGFLRAEPADAFTVDVTHDILPGFPVMRWAGRVGPVTFRREIAAARSFGDLHKRLGIARRARQRPCAMSPVKPNAPDPAVACAAQPWTSMELRELLAARDAPLLRGWRPWRTALVWNERILPWARFRDEPVRHAVLDLIGDLALAGVPILGRIIAHNPSHDKTCALAFALRNEAGVAELVQLGDGTTRDTALV